MDALTKQLAIYVLFFEKVDQTIECLRSFVPSNINIYILNNGSSSQSTAILQEFCQSYPQIRIFSSPENLGVSKGRNFLVRNTTEKWMFFVDNDIIMETADWVGKVLDKIQRDPLCDAIVPRMYQAHEHCFATRPSMRIHKRRLMMENNPRATSSNMFPGGASIINRQVFNRLGLYEEAFFSAFEDHELAIRGVMSGQPVKAVFEDGIKVIHAHRFSDKVEDKRAAMVRYNLARTRQCADFIKTKYQLDFEFGDVDKWLYEQIQQLLSDHQGLSVEELHEVVDLLVQVNMNLHSQIDALQQRTLRGTVKRLVRFVCPGFHR